MGEGRELRKEVALAATPEQVWKAIATGPGISAWFVPTEVEPTEGGRIRQDFGSGFVVEGKVTALEPIRRFCYGGFEPAAPGQADYAFEFVVEGRDGGGTVVRFVQSGFTGGEGWDAEYDSLDQGWGLFFHNLAVYLEQFAPRPLTGSVVTMGFTSLSPIAAWAIFHKALGLGGQPAVGDQVHLTPAGCEPVTGVVDVVTPGFLGVRSADALYRFGAEGSGGCGVSAYHYFYTDAVDLQGAQAAWQAWLSQLFPPAGSAVREGAAPPE